MGKKYSIRVLQVKNVVVVIVFCFYLILSFYVPFVAISQKSLFYNSLPIDKGRLNIFDHFVHQLRLYHTWQYFNNPAAAHAYVTGKVYYRDKAEDKPVFFGESVNTRDKYNRLAFFFGWRKWFLMNADKKTALLSTLKYACFYYRGAIKVEGSWAYYTSPKRGELRRGSLGPVETSCAQYK